jgi:hypothetical protein
MEGKALPGVEVLRIKGPAAARLAASSGAI